MKPASLEQCGLFVALSVAGSLCLAASASAQDRMPASRALFDLGRALMASGRYSEACPKLEESARLEPGMGTRFNLAYCWERIGRSASAWALYLDVAAEARAAGSTEREQIARGLARDLEPRLAYLLVSVNRSSPGLEIVRDGVPLGRAAWGVPTPVDPGLHVVQARAPGKQPWAGSVNVPARHFVYGVSVPELADVPVDTALSARQWWGVGIGAASAAAIAAGTVFARAASEQERSAADVCPNYALEGCLRDEVADHDRWLARAHTFQTRAVIGFAVGGAAALGSALLLVLGSSVKGAESGVQVGLLEEAWGPYVGGVW
jgi:tetratricopeptide (TPR) repeat protein